MSDQGFTFLPPDNNPITPTAAIEAAAADLLNDPTVAPAQTDPPIPLGMSWQFDPLQRRFVRQGTAAAPVTGDAALAVWALAALASCRYAHEIFSSGFGIEDPTRGIGEAGDKAKDSADDWRANAIDALLVHDRIANVSLSAAYNPVSGQIVISNLLITTDEEAQLQLEDLTITPEA